MGVLTPEFIGAVDAEGAPVDDVFDRLARRVREGRFPFPITDGRYRVEQPVDPEGSYRDAAPRRRLRIVAEDGAAMRRIGLNDVTLWKDGDKLRYFVTYRGWTRFIVRSMFGFNLLGAAVLAGVILGVTKVAGPAWIGVGTAIFWGLLWPWILCALLVKMHPPSARRVLEEIVRAELDAVRGEAAQRSSRSRMGFV